MPTIKNIENSAPSEYESAKKLILAQINSKLHKLLGLELSLGTFLARRKPSPKYDSRITFFFNTIIYL